eukprot:scaffold49386_cov60-Phaeocystis_antarctica.AAC.4
MTPGAQAGVGLRDLGKPEPQHQGDPARPPRQLEVDEQNVAPRVVLAYLCHAHSGIARAGMLDGDRLRAYEVGAEQVQRRGGGVRLDLVFEVVGTADLEDVEGRRLDKMRGGAWRVGLEREDRRQLWYPRQLQHGGCHITRQQARRTRIGGGRIERRAVVVAGKLLHA